MVVGRGTQRVGDWEGRWGLGPLWAGIRPSSVGVPPPYLWMPFGIRSRGRKGIGLHFFHHALGCVECLGRDISLGNRSRRLNHQIAELWGVWTPVELACHVGGRGVTLFVDTNAGAIYQGVRGRASVGLWIQQWLLRRINLLLFRNALVVRFVFLPSFLHPADRVSRLEALCEGSRSMALEAAREIWRRLANNILYALYIGLVARYVGEGLGAVIPVPHEVDGATGGPLGLMGRSWISGQVEGGFMRFVGAVSLGTREASGTMQAVRGGESELGEQLALVCRLLAVLGGGLRGE